MGIASFNIDSVHTGERPVHTILPGHEIPIVEHLAGLEQLPERGSRFFAGPPKVKGFGTSPIRAFAIGRLERPAAASYQLYLFLTASSSGDTFA